MYTYTVGVSRNEQHVYVRIINSPAGRCFSRQPHLASLARAAIETVDLQGEKVCATFDLGRTIGNTNIVETGQKDVVFYAQQLKQVHMSRFVKNRSMEPSSELSIVFAKDAEGKYELADIWIGPSCPPFPGANGAMKGSKTYWQTHALTAGSEPIIAQSMTNVCPY